MSNIFQNGFDNCLTMRLSNSDYWDLFLCYDCKDAPSPFPPQLQLLEHPPT